MEQSLGSNPDLLLNTVFISLFLSGPNKIKKIEKVGFLFAFGYMLASFKKNYSLSLLGDDVLGGYGFVENQIFSK